MSFRPRWSKLRCALAGLVLAVAGASGEAQTPEATEEPFAERVEVEVVNVDVIVTDREKRRVLDLRRDDFELLVDGRPVPIEYFAAPRPPAVPATRGGELRHPPGGSVAAAGTDPADESHPLRRSDRARESRPPRDPPGVARVFRDARRRRGQRDGGGVRAEPPRTPAPDLRSGPHRPGARRARESPVARPARQRRAHAAPARHPQLRPRRGALPAAFPARRGAAPRARDRRLGRATARSPAAVDRGARADGRRTRRGRGPEGRGARHRGNPGESGGRAPRRPRSATWRRDHDRRQSGADPRGSGVGAPDRFRAHDSGRAECAYRLLHRGAGRGGSGREQCRVRQRRAERRPPAAARFRSARGVVEHRPHGGGHGRSVLHDRQRSRPPARRGGGGRRCQLLPRILDRGRGRRRGPPHRGADAPGRPRSPAPRELSGGARPPTGRLPRSPPP